MDVGQEIGGKRAPQSQSTKQVHSMGMAEPCSLPLGSGGKGLSYSFTLVQTTGSPGKPPVGAETIEPCCWCLSKMHEDCLK